MEANKLSYLILENNKSLSKIYIISTKERTLTFDLVTQEQFKKDIKF